MPAECSRKAMRFARVGRRDLIADFDGGRISSDAVALLLGAVDRAIGLIDRFADCFSDGRSPGRVVHDLRTSVGQRVFGIALGYEDIIDRDELRHDPVLGPVLGRLEGRQAGCAPLAGKSTLNRLEHAPSMASRYYRIGYDGGVVDRLLVDLFIEAHASPPKKIVLDLDATDDPIHGHQEGRFFHGYYDCHCYLPLYVFCGEHLLLARLRRSNIDASAGAAEEVERIVRQIRESWPKIRIILRADSSVARDNLMDWCEQNQVGYAFGLARNDRLVDHIHADLAWAEDEAARTGDPARCFADFRWITRKSWSRRRRVIAKAEYLPKGANPRFVVTSLKAKEWPANTLYEDLYCARGNMENRIKECQLDLFADRTSAATMKANQLRLYFASMAYVLITALRRIGLKNTQLEREYEARWQEGGFAFNGAFADQMTNRHANQPAADFVRRKIRATVHDSETAERLCPKDVIGCKRLCISSDYYPTFNRPNVSLIDINVEPIDGFTENEIILGGRFVEIDDLVLATGFDAMTGTLTRIDIRGKNGLTLRNKWHEGPKTNLGLMIEGFPNLFTITGPGSPSVLSNMLPTIEQHVDWITDCLTAMHSQAKTRIETTAEAEENWVAHVQEVAGRTLYPTCNSWYLGDNVPGKPRIFMPYVGCDTYRAICDSIATDDYRGFDRA